MVLSSWFNVDPGDVVFSYFRFNFLPFEPLRVARYFLRKLCFAAFLNEPPLTRFAGGFFAE
jgi:hypothetical protein